jgi:uncharacterized damage-inducible protein DinB
MFKSVKQFLSLWARESESTAKVLGNLTDASLTQPVAPGHRNLGELAWHIAASVTEISGHTGLSFQAPNKKLPTPRRAAEIVAGYRQAADGLATAIRTGWTDETLSIKDKLYGYEWPRGFTLQILLFHEIHHRGQATVLMRQAGLKVPAVYGSTKDSS